MQAIPSFTPSHRGGSGPPLVCLHGFTDTWRSWGLVLGRLERHHDVFAPTLAGHAGGPPLEGAISQRTLPDAVERAMDAAGIGMAHFAGNSLGGFVALQLAARGRARSVVAFAPAGGWAAGERSLGKLLASQAEMHAQLRLIAPSAGAIVRRSEGRRQVTQLITTHFEHIPAELLAHQLVGAARCEAPVLIEYALRAGYDLEAERIACPVRIAWGTEDKLLPWPAAARRLREDWLPQADWVELEGVGHCPQLDIPLETAELISGFTAAG